MPQTYLVEYNVLPDDTKIRRVWVYHWAASSAAGAPDVLPAVPERDLGEVALPFRDRGEPFCNATPPRSF